MTGKRKELKREAVAFETMFSWTLIGRTNIQSKRREDSTLMIVSTYAEDVNIADLWKL